VVAATNNLSEEAGDSGLRADHDMLAAAARGLMAIARHGLADTRTRAAAFQLLRYDDVGVVDLIIDGCREAWDRDPVFCRNVVARELALATFVPPPRSFRRSLKEPPDEGPFAELAALDAQYLRRIETGEIPSLALAPWDPNGSFERGEPSADALTRHAARGFRALALTRIADGTERAWVVDATEQLVHWTVARSLGSGSSAFRRSGNGDVPDGWSRFLGDLVAWLAGTLPHDDVERRLLDHVGRGWPATARLTAETLAGFVRHHFTTPNVSPDVARGWRHIAAWVLPNGSSGDGRLDATAPSPDVETALGLLLCVRDGRPLDGVDWRGLRAFTDVVERWVAEVGQTRWAFRTLLVFATAGMDALDPALLLMWLLRAANGMEHDEAFWRDDDLGTTTAEVLADILDRSDPTALPDAHTVQRLADLIHQLARSGVPLASQLHDRL
jgi:hypothetical protein